MERGSKETQTFGNHFCYPLLPPVVTDYKTLLSAQPHAGRVRWVRLLACAEPSFASLCCLVQPSFPPPPAPYYLGPTSRLSAISEIVDDQTLLSTPRASGVDNVIEYLEYQDQAEAKGQRRSAAESDDEQLEEPVL